MTKSTLTLTQSGLLAVLLQRQRYKVIELTRRRAHRKQARAAFRDMLNWLSGLLTAASLADHSAGALKKAFRATHESLTKAICLVSPNPHLCRTPGNRFTTTCGSSIPNGSSQMANPPCASWNHSIL